MPSLKISILESVYLIFMFLFFKTSIDFNVLRSPQGWWFEHLVGDDYGVRICPFGRVAIFALIFILILRHYVKIPQWFIYLALGISFVLSLMNMNAVVYLIPIIYMVLNNFVEVSMELEKYPQFHKRFMNLRKLWGVTEEFYENELSKTTFVVGSGKSGMKMWFSKTGYFFIKEMTKGDKLSLKKLMNDYIMYMRINKNSLLPKFYGIYKKNNIVYVIQKNLNPYKNGTWVFDLKGSHRRRTVLNYTIKKIGKDNNFGDSKIFINNAKKIKKQMKKDTTFLKKHNLMDYSLLLCMRTKPVKEKDWKIWGKGNFCCDMKGPGPSKKTPININMGIIDILQKYNIKKKMESVFKSKRHFIRTKRSSSEVSAIDSESYKERFDDFMDGIIQLKNNTTRKKKRTRKKRTRKK